ncbi:thioredoxin domain-containing protein [archaeon]|nr:thioredoxin domain-containing protein [archaeon]
MKITTLLSVLVLFAIISVISITPAFADHAEVTVEPVAGSGTLGCEETPEGCFIPSTATVDVGGKVIFSNTDSVAHTFTSGMVSDADSVGAVFDSSLAMAGSSFEWSPTVVGEQPYFCIVHPWMDGLIIVQEVGAAEEETHGEEHIEEETRMDETMMEKEEGVMKKMMAGNVDVTMSPPIEGSADAPVTIIEFGDYQCPKCEQWYTNEKSTITADYIDSGKAKLYFVDFPFLGQDSDNAANASYCADDQGKFWEYHSALYGNQGGINEGWANVNALKQFGADLELDTAEFNDCVDSDKHKDRVDYNRMVGASNGVEGTPVFILVGSDGTTQRIDGPQSSDIFAGVIDTMLNMPIEEAMAQEETMEKEMAETESMEKEDGGCLIATAAYGTELAPQVQFLREIRDNTVMSTASGAAFMTGFNQLYYSFSPTIADMERENPMFQEAIRVFITPMISTLSILSLAEDGNEFQVFGLGASVIALNLGMYIAAPAIAGFAISKRLRN